MSLSSAADKRAAAPQGEPGGARRSGRPPAGEPRRSLPFAARRKLFLFALGAPAVCYVLLVGVGPLLQGAFYGFFEDNLQHPARRHFVGLGNYLALAADRSFRTALANTAVFTLAAVTLEFLLGMALALLLWRDGRFNRIGLALLLIPVTITPIAVGLIFKGLLGADYGMVGFWLAQAGWSSPRGLFGDPATALGTLVLVDVWEWTPLVALILLAGLKALPADVLEAAAADGATAVQRFRLVVLPLMLPAVFLALVLRFMDAFRIFDTVYVTTGGGPAGSTDTLMILAVKQGLQFFNIGMASAIGNVMTLILFGAAGVFAFAIRRAERAAHGG